jgi:hypothetical protein
MENTAYFDNFGRCIPNGLKADHHLNTRRYFLLEQPEINYKAIYERLVKHLKIESAISLQEFTHRAESILDHLRADENCKNILNGVHVPFMLRKKPIVEMGLELEQHYIYAVKNAFEESFPTKTFTNHHKEGLEGKLKVAEGSRHQQLVEAMQKDIVVGYYFPCLMEYSVPATLEQVAKLPEQFLLAGGCDTAAAIVGSPDLLLRNDGYPPVIWFAGLDAEKQGVGYHFEAYGYNLTFNRKPHFDRVAESWTSGLVVLG